MAQDDNLVGVVNKPKGEKLKKLTLAEKIFQASQPSIAEKILKESDSSPARDGMLGINVGIAEILDFPGDVAAGVTNTIGDLFGFEDIPSGGFRKIFDEMGFTPKQGLEPDSTAFKTGKFAGNAIGSGPLAPFGTRVQTAKTAVQGLGATIKEGAKSLVKDIGQTAVSNPAKFIATETVAGAGAGFGVSIAEEKFPNSPTAQLLGGVFGGATPTLAIESVYRGARIAIGPVNKLRNAFSESGARQRAKLRVSQNIENVKIAKENIDDPNILKDAESIMTPAQKSGDELLLELEKVIVDSDDSLALQSDKQLAQLNQTIINSIEGSAETGNIENTRRVFEKQQEYLKTLLDQRIRIAGLNLKSKLEGLNPGSSEEQLNLLAREEIEKALSQTVKQQEEIWKLVPEDVRVTTSNVTSALKAELEKQSRVARDIKKSDLPPFVYSWVGKYVKGNFKPGKLGEEASIKEIQDLRSAIGKEIRKERSEQAPDFDKIRVLDDLSDALLEDSGAVLNIADEEAGFALKRAINFSRHLNDRFNRGPVAKILGRDRRGGQSVDKALTLEQTLGVSNSAKAKVNARAILQAVKDNPDEMKGAMESFIKSKIVAKAVKEGKLVKEKAQRILNEQSELLNEFPDIKQTLQEAIEANDVESIRSLKFDAVNKRLMNKNRSLAQLFIGESPDKAFTKILNSRTIETDISQVMKLANRDPSGKAVEGLQRSFYEWLLKKSSIAGEGKSQLSELQQQFISGFKLSRVVEDSKTQKIIVKLLSKEQQDNLKLIVNTAKRLDLARKANPSKKGIIKDIENKTLETAAGILGAGVGRQMNTGTIQGPGLVASRFRTWAKKLMKDPAKEMLIEALTSKDPSFLKALLTDIESEQDLKFVSKQLNIWLASSLSELGEKSIIEVEE